MKQLLLVEDDATLRKTLCYNLSADGFAVTATQNVRTAQSHLQRGRFDLALLDVGLPDGSGYELCQSLKAAYPDMPVIFLTANDGEADQLQGYAAGAVDYITKPFSILALQRKMHALLQMLDAYRAAYEGFDDGHLLLDFSRQSATLDGAPLALSAMEFKVLHLFCRHPKLVLTRAQLLERLWDAEERFVDEHTLTTTVSRIRGKIEAGGVCYIKTVYGMGYLWTGGVGE